MLFPLPVKVVLTTKRLKMPLPRACIAIEEMMKKLPVKVQTLGSGISILLAVGTPSTGSGKLYCQWELSSSSGNPLCILFPTTSSFLLT
nr:hypothetical protein [Tanacetum cinerariifolium]